MEVIRWHSLKQAKEGIDALHRAKKSIGTIHTLGALHEGHSKLIKLAAEENEVVIVTIYPNIAQLSPSSTYVHDIEKDCLYAKLNGATHLITPQTSEMYPNSYCTFLNQGDQYNRLDGAVTPYLFPGMITMSIRWIIFTRPSRTYFGLKDIAQAILVKRAVKDLLIDTIIREVPCVRYKSGMAISSRMMNRPEGVIKEFNRAYQALEAGRKLMAEGERNSKRLIHEMKRIIDEASLKYFKLQYIKIADPVDFIEHPDISIPSILQIVMLHGERNWFEGFYLRTEQELKMGPETIWLDKKYPVFSDK